MISCYHENHIPSFSIALAFPIRPEVKKPPQPSPKRSSAPDPVQIRHAKAPATLPHAHAEVFSGKMVLSGHAGHVHVISNPSNKLGERVMICSNRRLKQKKQLIPAKFHNQKNYKEKKGRSPIFLKEKTSNHEVY